MIEVSIMTTNWAVAISARPSHRFADEAVVGLDMVPPGVTPDTRLGYTLYPQGVSVCVCRNVTAGVSCLVRARGRGRVAPDTLFI